MKTARQVAYDACLAALPALKWKRVGDRDWETKEQNGTAWSIAYFHTKDLGHGSRPGWYVLRNGATVKSGLQTLRVGKEEVDAYRALLATNKAAGKR